MNNIKYLGLSIPLDHEKTWDFLCKGENLKGIFQLETHSAASVLKQVKPRNISELSLVNALNRPGSKQFQETISDAKAGKKTVKYDHIDLEPILKDSYGCMVYQESLLLIAQKLAGFSAKDSNALLKSLGKKKMDGMESLKESFIKGMIEKKYEKIFAEELFEKLKPFANYGFNKSHSCSYSVLGFCSAYIKSNYPLQFFTSLLNYAEFEQNPMGEIFDITSEAIDFNILVKPPLISHISNKFEIINGFIHYPIGKIRHVGDSVFEKLKTLNEHQISSLDSFLEASLNIGINRRAMEFIIVSGGLENFGEREDILFYYWFLCELSDSVLQNFWTYKNGNSFSEKLIFDFLNYRSVVSKDKNMELDLGLLPPSGKVKYKSYFKMEKTREKTLETIKEKLVTINFYKKNKYLARFFWESYVLGYSYNNHFEGNMNTYRDFNEKLGVFTSCGFVEEVQNRTSKKGNPYGLLVLKFDKTNTFFCFSNTWEHYKNKVKEGDFIAIEIEKDEKSSQITQIENMTEEKHKYEFYNKNETRK